MTDVSQLKYTSIKHRAFVYFMTGSEDDNFTFAKNSHTGYLSGILDSFSGKNSLHPLPHHVHVPYVQDKFPPIFM